MARICYGVAGEGRGHATRVRSLVELLRGRHQVSIFASHDAFALLSRAYRGTEVEVLEIPGLRHGYNRGGRLSPLVTVAAAVPFLAQLPRQVQAVAVEVSRRSPDLIITDFEPILPRVAKLLGVPFVSLDHQRFLVDCDLSGLPPRLRWGAAALRLVVRAYYSGQSLTIISSFFQLPLKRRHRRTLQVGTLLRPELAQLTPEDGDHLVAYLRRGPAPQVVAALAQLQRPVRIYGAGDHPPVGYLTFHPVDERRFLADLASAKALITTAGNQVVGEAVAFRKPVFALPEHGNLEQEINAHFVEACGIGRALPPSRLTATHLQAFLEQLPRFRKAMEAMPGAGNVAAFWAVEQELARGCRPGAHRSAARSWLQAPLPLPPGK